MSGYSITAAFLRAAVFVLYIHSNTNKMRKCSINNSMRGAKGHDLPSWCIVLHIWTALLVQILYTMLTLSASKPLPLFELGGGRIDFWDVCLHSVGLRLKNEISDTYMYKIMLKSNGFKMPVLLLDQWQALVYCYISFYKIVWHLYLFILQVYSERS